MTIPRNKKTKYIALAIAAGILAVSAACGSPSGVSQESGDVFLQAVISASHTGGSMYRFELEEDGAFTVSIGSGDIYYLRKKNTLDGLHTSARTKLSDRETRELKALADAAFAIEKVYPTATVISEGPWGRVFYNGEERDDFWNPEISPLLDEFVRVSPLPVSIAYWMSEGRPQ